MRWKKHHFNLEYAFEFAWPRFLEFYRNHPLPQQERVSENSYLRTFRLNETLGFWQVDFPQTSAKSLSLTLYLNQSGNEKLIIDRIRRLLDLDSPLEDIEARLRDCVQALPILSGLRLPGFWSPFEAGIRAIIGQQISIKAAHKQISRLVENLGEPLGASDNLYVFPEAKDIAKSDLQFLGMPESRRQSLRNFSQWYFHAGDQADNIDLWQTIKGIGPWTLNYAKLRGLGDRDVWAHNDLGIKRAIEKFSNTFDANCMRPYRSYLCQQIWSQPHLLT